MIALTLRRGTSDDEGTIGKLYDQLGKFICYTGELPERDNHPNRGCILPGVYLVKYLARSASGRYRDVYYIQNVPKRNGVLIHSGNFEGDTSMGYRTDTLGCILPGLRCGRLGKQRAMLASKSALRKIHKVAGRNDFILRVM